jgi:integrase
MLCAQAGIQRHVRFHDLRHACATLMLDSGVELNTIKELLGHSALAITADVYAHVRLRLQHDAVERLDEHSDQKSGDDTDEAPEPPEIR